MNFRMEYMPDGKTVAFGADLSLHRDEVYEIEIDALIEQVFRPALFALFERIRSD
jgi:hypothetical protein